MTGIFKVIDKVTKEYIGTIEILRKDVHRYEKDFQLIEIK